MQGYFNANYSVYNMQNKMLNSTRLSSISTRALGLSSIGPVVLPCGCVVPALEDELPVVVPVAEVPTLVAVAVVVVVEAGLDVDVVVVVVEAGPEVVVVAVAVVVVVGGLVVEDVVVVVAAAVVVVVLEPLVAG